MLRGRARYLREPLEGLDPLCAVMPVIPTAVERNWKQICRDDFCFAHYF